MAQPWRNVPADENSRFPALSWVAGGRRPGDFFLPDAYPIFYPSPPLAPHIEKLCVFESDCGIPTDDLKTSVPNGMMKLIIPFRGKLLSYRKGTALRESPESFIAVVGLMESPVLIDGAGPLATIGIEIKAASAYRFFQFSLKDTTNLVHQSDEVFGRRGRELQECLAEHPTVSGKVGLWKPSCCNCSAAPTALTRWWTTPWRTSGGKTAWSTSTICAGSWATRSGTWT
jgi:hypothetical protein